MRAPADREALSDGTGFFRSAWDALTALVGIDRSCAVSRPAAAKVYVHVRLRMKCLLADGKNAFSTSQTLQSAGPLHSLPAPAEAVVCDDGRQPETGGRS